MAVDSYGVLLRGKKLKKLSKNLLTNQVKCVIIKMLRGDATSVMDACTTDK
jgi:hypothetical protein